MQSHEWHKSSYSGATTENCVEVAEGPVTAVRDTQYREAGFLEFPGGEWSALVDALRG